MYRNDVSFSLNHPADSYFVLDENFAQVAREIEENFAS
jgi:hypothetical protein